MNEFKRRPDRASQNRADRGDRRPQRPAAPVQRANYLHKCCICGRTDVSHPDLEFRYCSRCKGYHCYCEDHISNHTHIE